MTERVVTKGSVWLIDEDRCVYLRMPKTEGPRRSPEGEDWGGPGAGALEDLKWQPFRSWKVGLHGGWQPILVIQIDAEDADGKARFVLAPDVESHPVGAGTMP